MLLVLKTERYIEVWERIPGNIRVSQSKAVGMRTAGWGGAVMSLIWKEQRPTEEAKPQSGRLWRT